MPVVEFGPQLRPAPSPRHSLSSDDNGTSANNTAASSFLAPDAEADSTSSRRRHTLVPSGFECIAHPVFFRSEPFAPPPPSPAALSTNALRRAARAPATPRLGDRPNRGATSTSIRASVSAWNEEDDGGLIAALGTEELEGRGDCDAGGGGHTSGGGDATGAASGLGDGSSGGGGGAAARGNGGRSGSGSGREVDVECPICLGRFERQVTLTSCLHTFCHTCILGWYEHTVAVALSRGGPSAFRHPERGPAAGGNNGGSGGGSSNGGNNGRGDSSSSSSRAPAPYRCPLCKVPGPYFLAVKPAPPAPSPSLRASAAGKGKGKGKSKDKDKHRNKHKGKDSPKLTFRLLGVRTVLGGGGPASGGVEVEAASGGGGAGGGGEGGTGVRGAGCPTMVELRSAVRTQLAIAAAVSALENGGGVMRPRSGNGAVAVAVAAAGGVGGGGGGGEGAGEDAGGGGSGGGGEGRKARGCSGGGGEVGQEESNVTLSRSPGSDDKHRDSSSRSACSGTDPGTSCGNNASNSSTSNSSNGNNNNNGNNRDGDNSESFSSASTYRTSADRKCRSGRRTESRGDSGADAATWTEAAAAPTQVRLQTQKSPVSGGGKSSGEGGSGRRDRHRSHQKWQEEVASSSSPGDFDSHLASTAAGEGVGGGSGDGGQEERYSGSGSGSINGNSNNAERSRCAQPERSSASPRCDRHREKRRKRRRRDAEEVGRRRRSSSACGERRRQQRGGAESGRGMPDSVDVRGSRSSGRVVGSGSLPWEPGSMVAEDALAAIEAMLEREKESLRSRASEPGPSL